MMQLPKILKNFWKTRQSVWSVCLLTAFFAPDICHGNSIVGIVNKSSKVSKLTYHELSLIYKGRKKFWADGSKIVIFLPPPDSRAMEVLVTKILKQRSKKDVSRFYLKAVFQHIFLKPPRSFSGSRDAVMQISRTQGGIGIIDSGQLDHADPVLVISIK